LRKGSQAVDRKHWQRGYKVKTKVRLCRDLELNLFDTKEQLLNGIQSKELFQYLLIRTHNDEYELLFDIMDYMRIQVEHINVRFQN